MELCDVSACILTKDEEIRSRSIQYAVQLLVGRGYYPAPCCSDPLPEGMKEIKSPEEVSAEIIKDLQDDVITLANSFSEFIKNGKAL